jgi:TetR/AcrR family transcriptional repressor of nem operon
VLDASAALMQLLVLSDGGRVRVFELSWAERLMARKASSKITGTATLSTRERIKSVTTELLIRHGFRGTSFRTIAERLATTTTNIHYHFGNKEGLVEEVVRDYVTDASLRQKRIWLDESASLRDKLRGASALNRQRHRAFNRGLRTNRPWSLIGRLRLEIDVLSPAAIESLASFTTDVHRYVRAAVKAAAESGELRSGAPLDEIAVLLENLVNSGSVLSQDAGSFERLDQLFEAVEVLVFSAFGRKPRRAVREPDAKALGADPVA